MKHDELHESSKLNILKSQYHLSQNTFCIGNILCHTKSIQFHQLALDLEIFTNAL